MTDKFAKIFLGLTILFTAASTSSAELVEYLNEGDFQSATNNLIVVNFDDGGLRARFLSDMKREVWGDEQVTASFNAPFIPVAIEMDKPTMCSVSTKIRMVRRRARLKI